MTLHQWTPETKQRAEKAVAELEAFYDTMRASTAEGRKQVLNRLSSIRGEIASVTEGNDYVMSNMARLTTVCQHLSRLRQPRGFDASQTVSQGLGDVSNIRAWMHRLGLVGDEIRPHAPQ